jgi:hypothetical protein
MNKKSLGSHVVRWNAFWIDVHKQYEDLDTFGSSECAGQLFRSISKRADELIQQMGYRDFADFKARVVAATSRRWAHNHLPAYDY